MHKMAKNIFQHQLIALSISLLIITTPLPQVDWPAFSEVVFSETCQMSTSAQVFIECHWLAFTGSNLAENHLTHST